MGDSTKSVRVTFMEKCASCGSRGIERDGKICRNCGGSGVISETRTLNVKIPKGVKEGAKIRFTGEGKTDAYGRKGTLYLVVKYNKHPLYSMEDSNVTGPVEINPAEAVIGSIAQVKTLHGVVKATIPPGTQAGKSLRLKGLGLPKKEGGFGDHIAKIKIVIPEHPTEKEKELYKQLLELRKK